MTDRAVVLLSEHDGVAALQILAHLAYPHRAAFGLSTLLEWTKHRAKAKPAEKWSRLEPKLWRLDDMLKRRLKGSYWLRLQVNHAAGVPGQSAGQRHCARRFGAEIGDEGNAIRDYWTQTRRVAHLGLATGDAILSANSAEEVLQRRWDLVRIAFRPDWVARAINDAELRAAEAARFGVVPIKDATRFVRDSF